MGLMSIVSGKFSPLKIPGCTLWLEADRGITLVDGKVSAWADQSGNGRHAIQGAVDNRPTYATNQLNGYPAMQSAEGKGLQIVDTGIVSLTALTMILVFKANDVTTNQVILGTNTTGVAQILNNTMRVYLDTGIGGDFAYTSTATSILVLVFDGSQVGNENRFKAFLNGEQKALSFTGTVPDTFPTKTDLYIGAYTGLYDYCFTGLIVVPFLSFPSVLTSSRRQQIERHYSSKYAIALA